ncbi:MULTISPECIES: hypothetical protein [Chromobacterium]|uniref:Uncharacterized protein n=1 Tax=Chromobacterium rhizoryzae TaxID=1778675 RepID=A0AAD0RXS5_9NEIS|nr:MULTISPECIES: hypothetical protein [Chromobacterium]AXT46963.1 hypothetical protein D1345_12470 [Chromobacterium rhizoryzae]MDH0340872.1 hypothetical protein [Chromobacterium haemolyticum]OQS34074.1 hypothetical protein B0T40_15870 [Chromobacterium haemolyticum]PTU70708.1 hypothetical protein DBB33_15260 [Chromobacterium haemolyticum]QOD80785.1 hypothetical protein IEZ30_12435 [Chromobacterium haemolyticum]
MASPLTLLMPVVPGTSLQAIAATLAEYQPKLHEALTSIGTVHYARTLLLDRSAANLQPTGQAGDNYVIAVITEYDGSFNAYINDFVAQVGNVFDALLQFVVGGKALIPVANNVAAFQAFVTKNDASQQPPNNGDGTQNDNGLYQAYPYTVQTILAALG